MCICVYVSSIYEEKERDRERNERGNWVDNPFALVPGGHIR